MFNFFSHQKLPLGLDVSDISLKLIQFDAKDNRYIVQAYSDLNLPKDVLAGDRIKDPKLLTDVIAKAVMAPKFGKIKTRFVAASIPETKSFVRVIQMPQMTASEAAEAVPWEAEAYIPLPIGQVYLDWVILGDASEAGKMTVLITAAPRDYVDQFVYILKAAGLKPLALEVESQAIVRSLVAKPNETVMIADINTLRTSLIIHDKGVLQFTSSLPIAGNLFTESIARALSVGAEEAEKLKREFGIDENAVKGRIKKALLPVLNNLVQEIKNTIRFYEEHSSETSKISRLLLTGGSSKLKHLPSFLHEKLTHDEQTEHSLRSLPGIKVELGNPWINVLEKGQTPPLSREESLSYATAIGLGLRQIE